MPTRSMASRTTRLSTKVASWALARQGELVLLGLEEETGHVAAGHRRGLADDLPRGVVQPGAGPCRVAAIPDPGR